MGSGILFGGGIAIGEILERVGWIGMLTFLSVFSPQDWQSRDYHPGQVRRKEGGLSRILKSSMTKQKY